MDPTRNLSNALKKSEAALSYSGVNDPYSVRGFIRDTVANCQQAGGLVPGEVLENLEYIARGSGINHPENRNEAIKALKYLTSGNFRILR